MTEISYSALLSCTAYHMFCVINDVEAYPQFVDACVSARIIRQHQQEMDVQLALAQGSMRYNVTTRNRLAAPKSITMALLEGPFTELYGVWQIDALSDTACKVTLTLRFTPSSQLLGIASKALMSPMMSRFVNALVARAKQLYG